MEMRGGPSPMEPYDHKIILKSWPAAVCSSRYANDIDWWFGRLWNMHVIVPYEQKSQLTFILSKWLKHVETTNQFSSELCFILFSTYEVGWSTTYSVFFKPEAPGTSRNLELQELLQQIQSTEPHFIRSLPLKHAPFLGVQNRRIPFGKR